MQLGKKAKGAACVLQAKAKADAGHCHTCNPTREPLPSAGPSPAMDDACYCLASLYSSSYFYLFLIKIDKYLGIERVTF
jgi:hypothetical protein